MVTMKRDLCDMNPDSWEITQHQDFVKEVHFGITTYFPDLYPADQFFDTNPSYLTIGEDLQDIDQSEDLIF